MYLDAVRTISEINNESIRTDFIENKSVFEKWRDFPFSKISHHGARCCEIAREWTFAMDFSQLDGASNLTGPRWIRQRFKWGPTLWAIYWCEAIRQPALDCGAQAAIANEVFFVRGVESYPVQLVQQYSTGATDQWSSAWRGTDASVHWIDKDLIYHEGCAVVTRGDEIKLWDASAGWWINPRHFGGYGGLRAVRLFADDEARVFNWGEHRIKANRWQEIEGALNFSQAFS